jgi:AP-3 complex subunit beta
MQDEEVKYQVITLAAKVYVLYFPTPPTDVDSLDSHLKQIHLLYTYAMSLSRYDLSYDLRDRARLLKNVHLSPFHEAALHTPKPVPRMDSLGKKGAEWMLGSMAQVITRDTPGATTLPEWGSEIPEKGVRDILEPSLQSANVVSAGPPIAPVVSNKEEKKKEKKVWKDLDKFYASESEEEEDEEEDEYEEEEEEEEEEEGEVSDADESEEETDEDSEDERRGERDPLSGSWG